MNRSALVVAVTILVLVANYLGLFWQNSAFVFALGSFIIMGAVILWVISLVRRRG